MFIEILALCLWTLPDVTPCCVSVGLLILGVLHVSRLPSTKVTGSHFLLSGFFTVAEANFELRAICSALFGGFQPYTPLCLVGAGPKMASTNQTGFNCGSDSTDSRQGSSKGPDIR